MGKNSRANRKGIRMKILLTNCWQAGNTGDVAIWINLMRRLREAFPDAEFLVASQALLEWDCEQMKEFNPEYYVNDLIRAVNDADVVISQGGGYMISNGMYPYLQAFDLAQSQGKPTFFSTQTMVGPLSEDTRLLLKKVIDGAVYVSPRDTGTFDLLRNAGVERDMVILPDTVFDIDTVDWDFPYTNHVRFSIRGYDVDTNFLKEVALLADMATETMNSVVFLPIGHGGDRDDINTAKEIVSYMKHEGFVIDKKLTAGELKGALKDGILLSDRYHGIVYSVSMCTPFVSMSPDIGSKMPGLLEMFNYPIPVLHKSGFTAKMAFPHLMSAWENREKYRGIFETISPQIKDNSAIVYEEIIKGIKNAAIK